MKRSCFFIVFFIQLLTGSGQNLQWARAVGSTSYDCGYSLVNDGSGNVYVTGVFNGLVDFDPGPGTYTLSGGGHDNVFVLKLNSSGQLVWVKQFGGTGTALAVSIALDALGNIYTTGTYSGSVDFDPDAGTVVMNSFFSTEDFFISKLDTGGHFVWVKGLGGAGSDKGKSVGVDASGNVYTTGSFEVIVDFDPGPAQFIITVTGGNAKDIFLLKLDAAGNFVWAKDIGGPGFEEPYAMRVDGAGNCYGTGYFDGITDFDPSASTYTLASGPFASAFVAKYSSSGNLQWVYNTTGNFYSFGFSVTLDISGNVYATGLYGGTCDFDPGPVLDTISSNAGSDDVFLIKLNGSGNLQWVKSFGGSDVDYGTGIGTDLAGNLFVIGNFHDSVDFDPGPSVSTLTTSLFYADLFVAKYSGNGNFMWVRKFGGTDDDHGSAISTDVLGDVYMAGSFKGLAAFNDPLGTYTQLSHGAEDIFVSKLSSCPSPIDAIAGPLSFCGQANTSSYSVNLASGATGYTWSVPAGATILGGQGTNAISLSFGSSSGSISVNAVNACSVNPEATVSVSVFAVPQLTAATSNTQICSGESVNLSVAGAQTYTWSTLQNGPLISVSPTITTTYTVEGINANGCKASRTILQRVSKCAGLAENTVLNDEPVIYPNPTEGSSFIQVTADAEVKIFNSLAQVVMTLRSGKDGIQIIDLSNYDKGIYFVAINSHGNSFRLKLIKN